MQASSSPRNYRYSVSLSTPRCFFLCRGAKVNLGTRYGHLGRSSRLVRITWGLTFDGYGRKSMTNGTASILAVVVKALYLAWPMTVPLRSAMCPCLVRRQSWQYGKWTTKRWHGGKAGVVCTTTKVLGRHGLLSPCCKVIIRPMAARTTIIRLCLFPQARGNSNNECKLGH